MPRGRRSSNVTAQVISKRKVDTLQSRVLKWTTDDITNSKLFKKIEQIPPEFSSKAEYKRVFRVPLLEEVRAQVQQGLEKSVKQMQQGLEKSIKQGYCAPVRVTKVTEKKTKNQDLSMRKFDLSLSFNGRTNSSVKSSDLILLCCGDLPNWSFDSQECLTRQTHHTVVVVSVVYAEEKSPIFTATANLQVGSPLLVEFHSRSARQRKWFVVFLGISLIPASRIWSAIDNSDSEALQSVLQDLLRPNQQRKPVGINSLLLPQKPEEAETLQLVEEYCKSRLLNKSQTESLKSIVAGLLSTDAKCHVRLVQGPPGTGKTAMLVPLISVLGCLRWRTLVSAPTNAAVIEVCKRVICLLTKEPEKETPPKDQQQMFSDFWSRVTGLQGSTSDSRCSPLQLCDVVLVGSCMGKMGTSVQGNAALEKVFLPYRIERLMAALNPNTGWKGCVLSMEKFLTKAFSQFARKFEHDVDASSERDKENVSFWSFATEFMKKTLAQMETHLLTLTSELPKCHVDVNLAKAMTLILELMKRILNAMPRKAPVEARTWFGTTKSDALSEVMANLSLSESQRSNTPKLKFLQAREVLLTALAVHPGCHLLATKQNPQDLSPKYARLKSLCLEHAVLVFSTVSTAGSPPMVEGTFQCAIIDEASQLLEAESIIVSGKRGLKQLVLVGDHKQLPATVISKAAEESGYGRSLFDRLQTLKHGCRHMLNIQYRMKPEISRFPNSQFYDNAVKDGPKVLLQAYGLPLADAPAYQAYAFVNCEFGEEESIQKSWRNVHEVAVVSNMVQHLGKVCEARHIEHLSMGVISPYAMQVEAVKQSLASCHLPRALEVEVNTVDGFQGKERDVIIFTAVRSNSRNDIGFVRDERRLNVAITRGRYCLWIVGNAKTLGCKRNKVWSKLIADAEDRNCFCTGKL